MALGSVFWFKVAGGSICNLYYTPSSRHFFQCIGRIPPRQIEMLFPLLHLTNRIIPMLGTQRISNADEIIKTGIGQPQPRHSLAYGEFPKETDAI